MESLLSLVNGIVRQLSSGLVCLVLTESSLEINEVLGSVTEILLHKQLITMKRHTFLKEVSSPTALLVGTYLL